MNDSDIPSLTISTNPHAGVSILTGPRSLSETLSGDYTGGLISLPAPRTSAPISRTTTRLALSCPQRMSNYARLPSCPKNSSLISLASCNAPPATIHTIIATATFWSCPIVGHICAWRVTIYPDGDSRPMRARLLWSRRPMTRICKTANIRP